MQAFLFLGAIAVIAVIASIALTRIAAARRKKFIEETLYFYKLFVSVSFPGGQRSGKELDLITAVRNIIPDMWVCPMPDDQRPSIDREGPPLDKGGLSLIGIETGDESIGAPCRLELWIFDCDQISLGEISFYFKDLTYHLTLENELKHLLHMAALGINERMSKLSAPVSE